MACSRSLSGQGIGILMKFRFSVQAAIHREYTAASVFLQISVTRLVLR